MARPRMNANRREWLLENYAAFAAHGRRPTVVFRSQFISESVRGIRLAFISVHSRLKPDRVRVRDQSVHISVHQWFKIRASSSAISAASVLNRIEIRGHSRLPRRSPFDKLRAKAGPSAVKKRFGSLVELISANSPKTRGGPAFSMRSSGEQFLQRFDNLLGVDFGSYDPRRHHPVEQDRDEARQFHGALR